MYLNEMSYQHGVTSIVDYIESDQPVLAALVFRNLCRDGASPAPLASTVKTVLFNVHGPAVDKMMAVLIAGLGIVKTAAPAPVRR